MPTATLISKGRVTIPWALRDALGLHPGCRLDFVREANGFRAIVVLEPASNRLKGRFRGRAAGLVSLRQMETAIANEAMASWASSAVRSAGMKLLTEALDALWLYSTLPMRFTASAMALASVSQ